MKKLLVFLAILLLSFSLFAIDTSLTMGVQKRQSQNYTHAPFYISLDVWQDFGNMKAYGNYTNEFSKPDDFWGFSPEQDFFIVGVSYDFGAIKISAEHMCAHPVATSLKVNGIFEDQTKLEVTIH